MKRLALLLLLLPLLAAGQNRTFTNPLLPAGADPWSVYHDGWYYYTHTTTRNVTVWKTRNLADLAGAEGRVVWEPPAGQPYSKEVWAPELHRMDGKWYILVAADDGRNRNHRLWVLENGAADPLTGQFTLKGELELPDDKWAIDGSYFTHRGKLYLVWSGWTGDENGEQDIFLCRLKNPWTARGKRVRISVPTHEWEKFGTIPNPGPDDKPVVLVNEGPQPLARDGRLFVIYSASGCWTDHYALGMLEATGRNIMKTKNWKKHPQPVFKATGVSGTHAAGHNSFFKSPDGTEDWILYHANPEAGQGCGQQRSPRMQKIGWNGNGTPNLGQPVAAGVALPVPK